MLANGYIRPNLGGTHVPAAPVDLGVFNAAAGVVSNVDDLGRYLAFNMIENASYAIARWRRSHRRIALFIECFDGGEGGIRTHVPLTGQDAFEAPPLRPLRYLSPRPLASRSTPKAGVGWTLDYSVRGRSG